MGNAMRKIIVFISALLMIVLCNGLSVSEEYNNDTITVGEWEYLPLEDGSIEITKYHGEGKDLVIPASIDNRTVSRIGERAFSEKMNITSAVIPDGVKTIGDWAFSSCGRIEELTIPDSVISIGNYAFAVCVSLKQINIPEGVTTIGEHAFAGCPIEEIVIQNSVVSMGANPFVFCEALSSISVSADHPAFSVIDGVLFDKEGKELLVYPCALNNDIYEIPEGVEIIGAGAFVCSALSEVRIPDSIKSIGESAFYGSSGLTTVILPDGLTEICDETFGDCSNLTYISVPKSVKSIGKKAFTGCSSLKQVEISGNVTNMGERVFGGCSNDFYLTVGCFSYAKQYCVDNHIGFRYVGDPRSPETDNISLDEQDMMKAFSDIASQHIPVGPEATVHMTFNGFLVTVEEEIDRVISPRLDIARGFDSKSENLFMRTSRYCDDGYLCDDHELSFFFVQRGDFLYHYKFSRDTFKDSFTVKPDYVTVLYRNSGKYIGSKYEITSSGWFYAYGKYHLNEIESGMLVCCYDAGKTPRRAYLYSCDRSEAMQVTVSMDPYREGKTIWEAKREMHTSHEHTTEMKNPQTIHEAEKYWGVSFPYTPDLNIENPAMRPKNADEVFRGNYISEEIEIELPHLEGNMMVFDHGFDSIFGFNSSREESYDGRHIRTNLEYYTVNRGRLRYQFGIMGDEAFNSLTSDEYIFDLMEPQTQPKPDAESVPEYELECFDSLRYSYSDTIKDGIGLDYYEMFIDSIYLWLSNNPAEETVRLDYDIQTGELLDVSYYTLADDTSIDEWKDWNWEDER